VVLIDAAILAISVVLRAAVTACRRYRCRCRRGRNHARWRLYLRAWMMPAYNQAKIAPCPFRFQFAAGAGWDTGGALADVIAADVLFRRPALGAFTPSRSLPSRSVREGSLTPKVVEHLGRRGKTPRRPSFPLNTFRQLARLPRRVHATRVVGGDDLGLA
jgi:hypothetical protein